MTLLHADGFDHWGSAANMLGPYAIANSITISTEQVRTGNYSLKLSSFRPELQWNLPTALDEVYVGVAYYVNTFGSTCNPQYDNHTGPRWTINNAGVISFLRRDGTLEGSSPPNSFPVNAWFYYETYFNRITGAFEARVNGTTVVSGIAQPYTNPMTNIYWFIDSGGENQWLDDYVIYDASGDFNNSFLGDRHCRTTFLTADQANQDWVPATGASGYQMLDQVPPVPGTDYVEADNVNDLSSFQPGAIPGNTNFVNGCAVYVQAKKADNDAASYTVGFSNANGDEVSADISPSTTSQYSETMFELAPGGFFWDVPTININAISFNLERTS